jgi:hypothetical protein
MPSLDGLAGRNRSNDWSGIARSLLIQLLILAAVSVAAVQYINWSSDAAVAEIARAFEPPPLDHSPDCGMRANPSMTERQVRGAFGRAI